ncbi:PREDICTED: receptor-type tyrosine-protein phosphatase-like N isoform X1 [Polistes canadensis]|uniref:receptor-type tyrosine-protein phosphatase-like N isoform X1 n=1 Tax=Polistes canadensis TaxID=91411 RepID=UPI000718FDEA|nr:PREDICTED: receptor-type tyrosine-protein phosphatase-like N isoform X1 [Polistes canadensis]
MGCKPFWHRGLELLLLYILHHGILADGDVGCRFNINLCDSQTEVCYDDLAFGKCIPLYSNFDEEDLYQYNLDTEKLNILQLQLQRLETEGYKWSHPYTQCILRTSLYNLRHRLEKDLQNCQYFMENNRYRLKDEDIVDEKDKETVPFAIVKFTPNDGNSYGEFANEIYYPPGSRDESARLLMNDKEFLDLPYGTKNDPESEPMHQLYKLTYSSDPYNKYSAINDDDIYKKKLRKKSLSLDEIKGQLYQSEPYSVNSKTRYDKEDLNLFKDALDDDNLIRKLNTNKHFQDTTIKSTNNLDFLNNDRFKFDESYDDNFETAPEEDYEKTFSRKYKHPTIEFLNEEPLWRDNTKRHVNIYPNFDYQNKNLADMEMDLQRNDDFDLPREDALFTEGGMVQSLNPSTGPSDVDDAPFRIYLDDLDAILLRRELSGFKRRERLDVKKPGPLFSTNNHIFKMQTPITQKDSITETTTVQENNNSDVPISLPVKKELKSSVKSYEGSYKNVDTDHVYIEFQQEFHTWSEGERVVNEVSRLLNLNPGTLKDIRVGRAEVTFKVTKNNMNFNSTDVVNKIDDIRNNLRDTLRVDVIRAGIGDKAKLPATLEVPNDLEISSSLFGAIVAAGIAAAITAAVVTLVIVRRHAKSREKLAGLATPDPEASKDYQDLCRVRMQAKQTPEKQEPWRPSSSRENETNNFICDRSSTSSWTFDEPAFSNMDISTGHMVLSYMEDHLKNKDRLDQEWVALCSYGTSATDVAENDTNAKYNRPNASLPYDHSRIVLKELTNANNSNYINASTIKPTDHDPRNPAYIATQGPLPETTADLWQLIWEQGSVVIVALTRLTEDGRAMCHRYWPDQTEGSERYHIYEVHLVSEHPWCDDYLVRSFYLKNLLTGETRTVTQFHFLSWPENGVPHSTKALLEFRRKVNKSYRGRSCPIVVHCSDGAGRTGTYCLIDMVLNRIAKGTKEIDIAATLEHIRDQRPNMVATKQQFEFVLMAVAEEVHAILKALSIPSNENVPTKENISSSPTKSNQWL